MHRPALGRARPVIGSPPPSGAAAPDRASCVLVDRAQVHDLVMRYAAAVDRRDWELLESCFHPGVRVEGWGAFYGPRRFDDVDNLIDSVRGVEHFASTTHFLGNQIIHVHGDEAVMQTYALVTHRPRSDEDEWTVGGPSYWDRLVREDGRWRLARRGESEVDVDEILTGPQPAAPGSADPVVRWLADREEIRQLVAMTALAADRNRWDVLESCVLPGFELVGDEGNAVDTTDLAARVGADSGSPVTFLGNQLIDLEGDHARVETYAYLMRRAEEGQLSPWSRCPRRLVDQAVRVEGRWVLARREVQTNLTDESKETGSG